MHGRPDEDVLAVLSDGEAWTGRAIAERLGVSLRTVRRGLAALRDRGVAIDADAGPGGGLRLVGRPGLPRLGLDHAEVVSLLLALAWAESARLPVLGQGLRVLRAKLAATFPVPGRRELASLRRRILIGPPASASVGASWRPPAAGVMAPLQEAFVARRVVSFRYVDRSGRSTARDVEPQGLLLSPPVWYLLGHDLGRDAARTFRMDGIGAPRVDPRRFALRPLTAFLPVDGPRIETL